MGERSACTLITIVPFSVLRETVRVSPAGRGSGCLVGQLFAVTAEPAADAAAAVEGRADAAAAAPNPKAPVPRMSAATTRTTTTIPPAASHGTPGPDRAVVLARTGVMLCRRGGAWREPRRRLLMGRRRVHAAASSAAR